MSDSSSNTNRSDQIGPWRILEKIGAGGMGTVYLGVHEVSGDKAAVKVLSASLAREEGFVARFTREIEVMQQVSSRYIVQLLESGVHEESYYYAMEYVEGQTLTARLHRERRIPWEEVIDLSVQICIALKAAHDHGVIHRDLKPSNLLLTKQGEIRLTDFGVAQVFAGSKLTATGGIIGTAEYMSPEQAQGRRANKKSDLYSLGAVMYTMLTGRPPFTGKSTVDVIQKQRYGQFDRPQMYVPDIPHWLDEIVSKLLEKEPDDRYPDAYVLSLRLQEVKKKVALSVQEDGITLSDITKASGDGDNLGTAETQAADSLIASGAGNIPAGPGTGTLMRDFMAAEVERTRQRSTLGEFFNNTWVLIGMLVLVIAGGFWWFQDSELPPQEMFDSGVALMQEPAGESWTRARDDYFLPLLEQDDEQWQSKIEPYLKEIESYELRSSFGLNSKRHRSRNSRNDIERFLLLAKNYHEAGDFAAAEDIFTSLIMVLEGEPQYDSHVKLIRELLVEVRKERVEAKEILQLPANVLARAKKLYKQGEPEQAQRVLTGLIKLYHTDSEEIQEAKKLLEFWTKKEASPADE